MSDSPAGKRLTRKQIDAYYKGSWRPERLPQGVKTVVPAADQPRAERESVRKLYELFQSEAEYDSWYTSHGHAD